MLGINGGCYKGYESNFRFIGSLKNNSGSAKLKTLKSEAIGSGRAQREPVCRLVHCFTTTHFSLLSAKLPERDALDIST